MQKKGDESGRREIKNRLEEQDTEKRFDAALSAKGGSVGKSYESIKNVPRRVMQYENDGRGKF